MLLLLVLPMTVTPFFFPQSGGGGCSCGCAPPPACPPVPTCAVPGPCPEYSSSDWSTGVQAVPAVPAQVDSYPSSYGVSESLQVMTQPCTATITTGCSNAIPAVAVPAVAVPAVAVPQPSYIPAASQGYVHQGYAPPPIAVAPSTEYQEDRIIEVVAQPTPTPTLIPPIIEQPVAASSYDTAPPPLPPVPPGPLTETIPSVVEYKTSENVLPAVEYSSPYAPKEQYEEGTGINSGETSGYPKLGRKISTEGFMDPLNTLNRRNLILKRMRNVRTMTNLIPHTNTTCNSNKLANIMARAIVPDVSVAKRMVMRSAELAFDGAKFDVFCATGEFSYSIHSRKYCEVTRDEVTCFAFR